METQQLEFAMAAIRAGNFTQAAKRCFTSRQNIAHAVKSIEGIFHLTLFRREGRQLVRNGRRHVVCREGSAADSAFG